MFLFLLVTITHSYWSALMEHLSSKKRVNALVHVWLSCNDGRGCYKYNQYVTVVEI